VKLSEVTDGTRAFLAEYGRTNPLNPGESPSGIAEARQYQRALYDADLAGLTWDVSDGGAGLPAEAERLFDAEAAGMALPVADLTLGLKVCGPAIRAFGSTAQRQRHLPATLRGEQVWCQLWSEPEAGSDLAGVRTLALPTATGGWLLRGQKIWTSGAHHADLGLALCRTARDATPKHRGLSMFIVNLRQPGVQIRPLRQMTGDAEFNEVFLDDVEVPEDCLLGALGQGWPIATWMMGRERVSVGLGMRDRRTLAWHDLVAMAKTAGRDAEPAVRHRLAEIYLRQRATELLGARIAQETDRKIGSPLRASALKVAEAAAIREAAEFAIELLGDSATVWAPGDSEPTRAAQAVLMSPAFAIGGGTDDIQLNTLAERLLGLPRDGTS